MTRRKQPFFLAVALLATAFPVFAQSSKPSPSCGAVITKIELSPLKYTKPETVLAMLVSKVGRPHCEGDLELDRQRLDRLRFFASDTVTTVSEDDGLLLKVNMVETSNALPNVGIGHSQENGWSLGPGLKVNNVAHSGVTLSIGSRFGGLTRVFANFANPEIPGRWIYNGAIGYTKRFDELNDFERTSYAATFRFGKTIVPDVRLHGIFEITTTHSNVDGITLSDSNRDVIPYLGPQIEHDTRDFWSDPHTGWHNILDGGKEFGDADYWRVRADFRRYVPLAKRHTLALTSLTDYHTGEVGVDFPQYSLSYIGGANSVRGWALGSRSGQNEMLNTVEYRYTLMNRRTYKIWMVKFYIGLQLAAFWDSGIAWTESNEFAADKFINGYGGGLRLMVPWVNEIRLDFAGGQPGGGVRFELGFGPKADAQKVKAR
jgi:outer membrane protein assembly factor BamA